MNDVTYLEAENEFLRTQLAEAQQATASWKDGYDKMVDSFLLKIHNRDVIIKELRTRIAALTNEPDMSY